MDARSLTRYPLFSTLSDRHAKALATAFTEERFERGARVFSEGDRGDKLYLIESGAVRISQRLGTSGEEALAVLHPGDYFGDMSLIDAHPRSADAIAEEDLVVQTIEQPVFITCLKADAELALGVLFQFIHTLTSRLRENNERLRALHLMSMW